MNATSVTLVLEQLQTALAITQALVSAAANAATPDARPAELMLTLTTIEQELRQLQKKLGAPPTSLASQDLHAPMQPKEESPYYWEDE